MPGVEEELTRVAADESGPPWRRIGVLVVARQPVARAGLRALLAGRADVIAVGQASSVDDGVDLAARLAPDAALTMWGGGELEDILALGRGLHPSGVPLLLLAEPPDPAEVALLLASDSGVRGIILAEASPDEIAGALHAISEGLFVLDSPIAAMLAAQSPHVAVEDGSPLDPLSERELEVVELLALGLPNKTIARRLGISEHTVKFHVGSILAKLGAASRTEAVTRAARRGLIAL
jgi:DNA-binding NarL/FixJ family response regulator